MPQKYKRKEGAIAREATPPDIMKQAVDKVLVGSALHTVAKEFGISRNTLRRYVRKIQNNECTNFKPSYSPNQVFSPQEETELCKYLEHMARMNHGLTTKMMSKLAYDLAIKNNKTYPKSWDKEKLAGYFWRKGFMDRHQELSLKKPEATSLSRCTSFNKHNVSAFYKNLKDVLTREKFEAHSVWNADETGVTTVQRCPKVIAPKNLRQVGFVTSAERGQTVTVLNSINALGNSIPPFFIFPRVKMNPAFLFGAPPGSGAAAHISGWMTEDNFVRFLEHFAKFTRCSVQKKVLLLTDNHESHLSLAAIDFARANGIVVLTFPPHCSHRLQPLDVSVYSPFKGCYNTHVTNRLMVEKPGIPLSIYDIAGLVGKAFPQSFTPSNIVSGFEATGIWPFNDQKFTEIDFMCAAVTDRPNPNTESDPIAEFPTTSALPDLCSTTAGFCISPEIILPYPQAGPRKDTNKGRKKGRTMIATDTPNKTEIELKQKDRDIKRQKKEERVKKTLFGKKEKNYNTKQIKKPETESYTSVGLPTSNYEPDYQPEPQDDQPDYDVEEMDEMESDTEFYERTCRLTMNEWTIVKYSNKRSTKYFVGQVLESSSGEVTIKFAKRIEGRRCKWPDKEDISVVDRAQIVSRLEAPDFTYQNDRITSFLFKNKFDYEIE